MIKRLIIHPFTFAVFPILALLAHNIAEVAPRVAIRTLAISLTASVILLLILALISRSWPKAALATTLFLVLFYSYGQVYEFLQAHPIFNINLGRHRYLVIVYGLILIVGLWAVFFKSKDLTIPTQMLNVVGILLLVYPIIQIESHGLQTSISEQRLSANALKVDSSVLTKPNFLPDFYYIILDGYTRGDALLKDLGYDNSAFLDELKSMGFYVASCSMANYGSTRYSMITTLNMDYLPTLTSELDAQGFDVEQDLRILLKQSKVRGLLESMGYKTVAFESDFEWIRLRDAEIYLQYTGVPYEMQVFQPFEAMLIRSSALLIWSDSTYKALPAYNDTIFGLTKSSFEDHINRQLYILDQLPRIPSMPGAKFVFVHIAIPHPPYVFTPTGDVQTNPDFYSLGGYGPIDGEHEIEGYLNGIKFLNSRIPDILRSIIAKSYVPPVIVLMGDHGALLVDHYLILNSYYLPENAKQELYPSISPVNSYRLIFDAIFKANYNLLPDITYETTGPIPEPYPDCLQ